jgi:hypothetical protein
LVIPASLVVDGDGVVDDDVAGVDDGAVSILLVAAFALAAAALHL